MKNLKLNTRDKFIRLISLLVIECFIVSNLGYEEITAILRNGYISDELSHLRGGIICRSLNLSPQTDFSIKGCFPKEQACARLSLLSGNCPSNPNEAPLNTLVPPLKTGKLGRYKSDKKLFSSGTAAPDQPAVPLGEVERKALEFEYLLRQVAASGGARVPRFILTDDGRIFVPLEENDISKTIQKYYANIGAITNIEILGEGAYSSAYKVETEKGTYTARYNKRNQYVIIEEFKKGEEGDWNKVQGKRLNSAADALFEFHNSTQPHLNKFLPFKEMRSEYLAYYPFIDLTNLESVLHKLEKFRNTLKNRSPPPDSPEAYFLEHFDEYISQLNILRERVENALNNKDLIWTIVHGDFHPKNVL